jgi:hypothetical protein
MKKLIDFMYGLVLRALIWPRDYRRWKKPVPFSSVRVFFGYDCETFEEHPILPKYKEGDNFNHRNTLSISRIALMLHFVPKFEPDKDVRDFGL